jgi:hypothetical protein
MREAVIRGRIPPPGDYSAAPGDYSAAVPSASGPPKSACGSFAAGEWFPGFSFSLAAAPVAAVLRTWPSDCVCEATAS